MKYEKRLWAGMLLLVLTVSAQTLSAQTLAQAEALWKARRFKEANEVFKQLEKKEPKNPDYKVRWGRMMMDHAQPTDAEALFSEALEIKKDHAGALLGLALLFAENFDRAPPTSRKKALESDPKLVEAQELLARLALEDNNNPKATEEAKKALAMDREFGPGQGDSGHHRLAGRQKGNRRGIPTLPKATRPSATSSSSTAATKKASQYYRKAIELDPQLYSARSQLGINLMRLGQNDEAYKQLETCFNNDFQDRRHAQLAEADGQLQELRHLHHAHHHPEAAQEGSRAAASLFPERNGARHGDLREEVQVQARKARAGGSLSRPRGFRGAHLGMPGLGALGVTFGYVVAMDSPSGRKPGTFHWASTLWHELSHVYMLTATEHRVPRWFTEGLAVHEETAVSPDWGDRLDPDVISAIKDKKLLPIAELDRGFMHPTYPAQVICQLFPGRQASAITSTKSGAGTSCWP